MTKQEYLDKTPNVPLVVCDKHYFIDGKPQGELHRCQMTDNGWKCPKCKEIYPYLA